MAHSPVSLLSQEHDEVEKNGQRDDSNLEEGKKQESTTDEEQYPPLRVVIPTMLSILLALFLAALDRTIVGVAVPAISNEFQSFEDIAWYEAAFLLSLCIFQLPMGKIYTFFSAKWTTISVVVIFEAGSIICASAPSSVVFIIGRAITGIGGAGIVVAAQVVLSNLVPLRKRPKYQGSLGAVFGLSSIIGPLVGGAFTTNLSWRWCFWISLPIGGVALAGLVFVLPDTPPPEKLQGTLFEKVKRFDLLGNAFLVPGVICLLLALQWGGSRFPWDNTRIIALLVVGIVLLGAFVVVQLWVQEENATIPPRIFNQRSILSSTFVSLGLGSVLIISTFYLPIWYQAIEGTSAGSAGVRLLAYFLSTVLFIIASGFAISKGGYYNPYLIGGCAILIVGTALLATLRFDTGTGKLIGFQILVGAGVGLSLQQPNNAAQTVLAKRDIPTGITLLAFATTLGGSVFVSCCQSILSNTLMTRLAQALPNFDASKISSTGATEIRNLVSAEELPIVLEAYATGINNVFYCALALACLAFVASLFLEWKTVQPQAAVLEGTDD